MKLDIRKDAEARYYQPYLNGEKLMGCFAASEEDGWADVYVADADGNYIVEENGLRITRLFGKVELKKEYGN